MLKNVKHRRHDYSDKGSTIGFNFTSMWECIGEEGWDWNNYQTSSDINLSHLSYYLRIMFIKILTFLTELKNTHI